MSTSVPAGKPKGGIRYFYRLIWLVCLAVCIPVVLAGSVYYQLSVTRLTEQLKEQHLSSLQLVKDRIEDMLTGIEYESLQISNVPYVVDSFYGPGFQADIIRQYEILRHMGLAKNANSLISDIVYYNHASQVVLSNDYGYVQKMYYRYQDDIDQALAGGRSAGWRFLPASVGNGYISYVRMLPATGAGSPQGALIIHVPEERISRELLNYSQQQDNPRYLVADSSGRIMFSPEDKRLLGRSLADDPRLAEVLGREESAGIVASRDDEGMTTYHFFRKTLLNRVYIASLTEEQIAGKLQWIQAMIVSTVLIFVGVGVLMSLISSKLAYNPVERLVRQGGLLAKGKASRASGNELDDLADCLRYLHEQTETLSRHLRKIEPSMREQFLARLVKGKIPHARTVQEEADTLQIPEDRTYLVMILTPENMYKEKRFHPEEGSIVTFAITNVMKELLQKAGLEGYVFGGEDMEVIALLHREADAASPVWTEDVDRYAHAVCDALKNYLSFTVSIGVGRAYPSLGKAAESYREALLALQYRLYKEPASVYYIDELGDEKKKPLFFYPRDLETVILECLDKGDLQPAEQYLHEFSEAVKASESYNLIYQSYQVLLSSIIRSLETKGIGLLDIMENNWFDQLKSRQTMTEIEDWFQDVLFPLYLDILEKNRSYGSRSAIQKICEHIKTNIGEQISLTECAELAGMSTFYLSRMFRRETGMSFVDYVMECKVEEAKRLLRDTDASVVEIARLVGYSERHLNRTFQKLTGMAPGQFRSNHR